MKSLIEALRVRYDVVILDTAPVMPISDTRVLSSIADAVVLVARWGRTPASVVRGASERLRAHGAKIAGVVLEGVETGIVSRLLYDRPDFYSDLYQTYFTRQPAGAPGRVRRCRDRGRRDGAPLLARCERREPARPWD